MSQGRPEEKEKSPDPETLYCMRCRKKMGYTYSPHATQTALRLEATLALSGQGECVNPQIPHQTPLVTRDQLPPVATVG